MTESENGFETTRISRRKAIKLGALGAAGGAAAWLLPGTAGAGQSLVPPGMCARGSGDVCGRQPRQCGISKPGGVPNGELCVCASDSTTPAVHCVEDRIDEGFIKCQTKADCPTGQLCVKRCISISGFEFVMPVCAWPCNQGPPAGED